MVKTFALCSLFLAAPARAEFALSGYLKDIEQYSRGLLDNRPYSLNTARARLTLDASRSGFKAHADYDHQLAAGSYFRTLDFKTFGYAPPSPWLTMQSTLSTGTLNGYGQGVYRGWVGYETDTAAVRVGRQRVAWGTGKVWNPTDVLNAYQPTSIERDERRGVDALYARQGLGNLGQIELVWAPNDRFVDHALLARAHGHLAQWDASLMGGKIAGSTGSFIVGGDFAGTLAQGTLHGELAWLAPQISASYLKAGLGFDYTFATDLQSVVEWYRTQEKTSPGSDYFALTLSQDLHPLLKFELIALVNADDASSFLSPTLTWNALKDFYLSAAHQRYGGRRRSQFGRLPNQMVFSGQYYF